jgi:putative acetyltransferase
MPARADVVIRPEEIADHEAIHALTARAFAGHAYSDGSEPRVIDGLRDADALALSLVALVSDRLVGHVAFSPVAPRWFALGPVSVEPALQRQGIGARLIHEGLHRIRERGADGCVLVGDHRYYARFGFALDPSLAPPGLPAAHFQWLSFHATRPEVPLVFHRAFGA